MEDVSAGQPTRLIIINNQAILVTGDVGDGINDISPDVLQRALTEVNPGGRPVALSLDSVLNSQVQQQTEIQTIPEEVDALVADRQQTAVADDVAYAAGNDENFVAIFQGEHGDTQTIQLTSEQVEALGLTVNEADVTENLTATNPEADAIIQAALQQDDMDPMTNEENKSVTAVDETKNSEPVSRSLLKPCTDLPSAEFATVTNTARNVDLSRAMPRVTKEKPKKVIDQPSVQEGQARSLEATIPTVLTVQEKPLQVVVQQKSAAAAKTHTTTSLQAAKPTFNTDKPLGSSENPIQLVQHGSTFHSMQPLNNDQLRQIATVLQQRRMPEKTSVQPSPANRNVVFDAETNTKIIYRIVYPGEDAAKKALVKTGTAGGMPAAMSFTANDLQQRVHVGIGKRRRGRPPKLSGKVKEETVDYEDERLSGPEMSKEEKEEKKKQLMRTRSGRLSRPPKHMVKDYKRLHHLDFAEPDLDDSDGGYSDYQVDEDEERISEGDTEDDRSKSLLPGLAHAQRKRMSPKYRCPTCQKLYLGRARMARHFEIFPGHGSANDLNVAKQNANDLQQHNDAIQKPAETKAAAAVVPEAKTNGLFGLNRTLKKKRGRYAYVTPEEKSQRRKMKLQEALEPCTTEEILQVAGTAVASRLRLDEVVRFKCNEDDSPFVSVLVKQLKLLLDSTRKIGEDPSWKDDAELPDGSNVAVIDDEVVSAMLNLPCGRHVFKKNVMPVCASKWETVPEVKSEPVRKVESLLEEPPEKRSKVEEEEDEMMEVNEQQSFSALEDSAVNEEDSGLEGGLGLDPVTGEIYRAPTRKEVPKEDASAMTLDFETLRAELGDDS